MKKLKLYNTINGLIPCYDEDYEEKKKLKIGEYYTASIQLFRNPVFHDKYFSLMRTAWAYQNEKRQTFFKTFDNFRKAVELSAGSFDLVYSIEQKEWVQTHKSISFGSMDESEFQELYERVKDVLFDIFLTHITQEEFEKVLLGY